MPTFTETITEWRTFYSLAGTAAATLIGLLFVAVSIHIDIFARKTSADIHHFAALTFNCFFYVLLVAMLFLIPSLSPLGLGIPLFMLGGLGFVNAVVQQRRSRRNRPEHGTPDITTKFNIPIACMLGMVIVGVCVMFWLTLSLYGLIAVIFALLISAAQNAWTLLVQMEFRDLVKLSKRK